MKPWRIVISIVVLIISLARLATTCSKRDARDKQNSFVDAVNMIEVERSQIVVGDGGNIDDRERMLTHAKAFEKSLDSVTSYYRNNYKSDETRYEKYLDILYEYKKISYVYFAWFSYMKRNPPTDDTREKYDFKRREFNENLERALQDLQRKERFY